MFDEINLHNEIQYKGFTNLHHHQNLHRFGNIIAVAKTMQVFIMNSIFSKNKNVVLKMTNKTNVLKIIQSCVAAK